MDKKNKKLKTPFEQAEQNAKIFVETADMLQTLSNLSKVISEAEALDEHEREGVYMIVDASLKTLSGFLTERGHQWN